MNTVERLNAEIEELTNELEFMYPLIGKTIRSLPIDKITGTETYEDANTEILDKAYQIVREKAKAYQDEEAIFDTPIVDEERLDQTYKALTSTLIQPQTAKEAIDNNYTSGWLLTDGTFYGGEAYDYIHDHIIEDLVDANIFTGIKDSTVENENGWIKLSYCKWHILYNPRKGKITPAQIQFVLEYEKGLGHDKIQTYVGTIEFSNFLKLLSEEIEPTDITELNQENLELIIEVKKADQEKEFTEITDLYFKKSGEDLVTKYLAKQKELANNDLTPLITSQTAKEAADKKYTSGWLLGDGRFFGGVAYYYIHEVIIEELHHRKLFDRIDTEADGWIKLSGADWLLYSNIRPTPEQIQFIMAYEKAIGHKEVQAYGGHITYENLLKLLDENVDPSDIL